MKDYDVYAEYCKNKKIHGLRLRSIMRVFNYIYRNNDAVYNVALDNWCFRLNPEKKKINVTDDFINYCKDQGYNVKVEPSDDPDTFEKVFGESFIGVDMSDGPDRQGNKILLIRRENGK